MPLCDSIVGFRARAPRTRGIVGVVFMMRPTEIEPSFQAFFVCAFRKYHTHEPTPSSETVAGAYEVVVAAYEVLIGGFLVRPFLTTESEYENQ